METATAVERVQARRDMIVGALCMRLVPLWVTPNMLTMIRMCLAPIFLCCLVYGVAWAAIVAFILGALLDFADGPLARMRGSVSWLGMMLDPVADKLFFLPPFGYLLWRGAGATGSLIVLLLLLECVLVIMGLLEWMPSRYIRSCRGANIYGKIKTTIEAMIVLFMLLGVVPANTFLTNLLFFAAILGAVGSVSGRVYGFRRRTQ